MALDLSQPLDVLTLSLAILGSALAVLSGKWIEERYKRKNWEKKVKSRFLAYLNVIQSQVTDISALFYGISKQEWPKELGEGDVAIEKVQILIQSPRIDNSYFEKSIRDNLLYLRGLARYAVVLDMLFSRMVEYYDSMVVVFSKRNPSFPEIFYRPNSVRNYLNILRNSHKQISELGVEINAYINSLRNILLKEEKFIPSGQPMIERLNRINNEKEQATKDFMESIQASK